MPNLALIGHMLGWTGPEVHGLQPSNDALTLYTVESDSAVSRESDNILHYSFPTGPSTLGRHGHGTRKHGPSTARPGSHCARAWHGPTLVPCLGRNVGPWAGPGTARLTGRHDGGPLFSAVG